MVLTLNCCVCSAVPKDMTINVMDMRPGGWIRLAVTDTGGHAAVKSIAVRTSGSDGSWREMKNTWGAAYELDSSPQPPLDFKISMVDGEELIANDVVKDSSGISGGVGSPVKFDAGIQAKITDPAMSQVQAFGGENDPMLVTSDTPGNTDSVSSVDSSSSSTQDSTDSSSSSDETGCTDNQPPGGYSCDQQKDWGKCDADWMTNANYCSITCGFCSNGRRRLQQNRRSLQQR